jgi:hypothetical protein
MSTNIGYIYIRNHPSYDMYDACKLGKTCNIPDRDRLYATGEIKRGYFELVFEMSTTKINIIEKLLQNEFSKFNIKYDAGIEFYNKKIITLVEPYLQKLNITYKKLNEREISNLVRCNRIKSILNKINIQLFVESLIAILKKRDENIVVYTPRDDPIKDFINTILNVGTNKNIFMNTTDVWEEYKSFYRENYNERLKCSSKQFCDQFIACIDDDNVQYCSKKTIEINGKAKTYRHIITAISLRED